MLSLLLESTQCTTRGKTTRLVMSDCRARAKKTTVSRDVCISVGAISCVREGIRAYHGKLQGPPYLPPTQRPTNEPAMFDVTSQATRPSFPSTANLSCSVTVPHVTMALSTFASKGLIFHRAYSDSVSDKRSGVHDILRSPASPLATSYRRRRRHNCRHQQLFHRVRTPFVHEEVIS